MEEKINIQTRKRKLVAFKIYFDRARMYLGYINFFILNLVLLNSLENPELTQFINDNRIWVLPILFITYMTVLILIGYFDTRLGLRQEELRNNASKNPVMVDLMKTVNEIQMDLKTLNQNVNSKN